MAMRNNMMLAGAAFLLTASHGLAQTQQAPQAQPPEPASRLSGTVDIGGQFSTIDGDEARFQRYRDARDGLYSQISLNRQGTSYLFDANASHVGYRDQRYKATVLSRKLNVGFDWVSIPLNYSYIARTPYVTSGNTLSLDDAAQRAVQGPT